VDEKRRKQRGYRVVAKDQAGALAVLRRTKALAEIRKAVIDHCEEHAPNPPYRPQAIKQRLAPSWVPEVRVPPFASKHDELPINDRYDLWKPFKLEERWIGLAIEIEKWEVWTDLLKFRRGINRGPGERCSYPHLSRIPLAFAQRHQPARQPRGSFNPVLIRTYGQLHKTAAGASTIPWKGRFPSHRRKESKPRLPF
jgi:hypothetical protein